jgi:hypothetical protein
MNSLTNFIHSNLSTRMTRTVNARQDAAASERSPFHAPRSTLLRTTLPGLLLAALTGAAQAFVYETPWEFQSDGDFNGDGLRDLVIVDKATGDYRLAYQLSADAYTWVSPRASGVPGATGLGVGKVLTLFSDSLAITSPDANRINLLDVSNTVVAGLPASVFIPSIGPGGLTAIDIGGTNNTAHLDLYVTSLYNGALPYRETLVRDNGTTNYPLIADNPLAFLRERLNPVLLHTNRVPRVGLFERNTGASQDTFKLLDFLTNTPTLVASLNLSRTPNPNEFISGQFATTNPYTQFLFYAPAGTNLNAYQITEPSSGTYNLVSIANFGLSNTISQVVALPGSPGGKLLLFDTNGTTAVVYSFDGIHAPSAVQTFTAAAGEHFTGAGVLGKYGFTAYSAPLGQNTSAKFRQLLWSGSGYTNGASGDLPRLTSYTASGNVMQFRYEPFVTNNPVLLRLNSAGDWTGNLAFSGSPGNISVKTETFGNSTQGLANPTATVVGAAHPLAQFGLANQYSNMISLFSFTPPAGDKISDVTISPTPGVYSTSITLQFAAANPTDTIFYRLGASAWSTWSNAAKVVVFTNTTVQYYGQPTNNSGKSSVQSAAYAFTQGPATLDSKGDGIPDYVKIAKGLSLTGSRDSDGDGYSDLEELIHGTNPTNNTSAPTNFPHLDDQAVFDLNITPRPWDGFSNVATLCATGAVLHAYALQGDLLGNGSADSNHWPVGILSNITFLSEDRLVSYVTDSHFNIVTSNSDKTVGREMLGLVATPPIQFPKVSYVYAGGNLTSEANNWIIAASNAYASLPRTKLSRNLTPNSTLESLLFELKVAQLLGARSNAWWTNITLFPFRVGDAGRTNPTSTALLALEKATNSLPGYKLQAIFASISNQVWNSAVPAVTNLRAVVQDIYRIDSLLNNTNPATFALPPDEIRSFLWNGTLDTNYLPWATTSSKFASAFSGAASILAGVGSRPVTNVMLVVRADTLGTSCRPLDLYGGGVTFALQDSTGLPFMFPNNFQLLPGCVVQVVGYADVTNSDCGYPGIEVTSMLLSSIPITTDSDLNGNLLIDTWERRFYGAVGLSDPFGDSDGDGYQNLQEMLEKTDPRDAQGIPPVAAVHFAAPTLNLVPNGSQMELHFLWPAYYIGQFNFGVRHTSDLTQPFTALPVSNPVNVSANEYKITFTIPATPQHFYYLTVGLN